MQIIHFKKFSVSVSTGTSKVDKLLKMPSDSISGIIFQNFLGGMPPDPPRAGMFRMPVCFAHYECKYLTIALYINNDDRSGYPPFAKV